MLNRTFSFSGRITRKEYAISLLLFIVVNFISLVSLIVHEAFALFFIVLFISVWLKLAQGAKRSHDQGNSGWYQIIPLYEFWLIFAHGDKGKNLYGDDPRDARKRINKLFFRT